MNPAVAIDDAQFRRIMHAGRSHVMPRAFLGKGRRPRTASSRQIKGNIGNASAAHFLRDKSASPVNGLRDQRIRKPPAAIKADTVSEKCVATLWRKAVTKLCSEPAEAGLNRARSRAR